MLYLSHSQAVDYVSRVAGMSRETFDEDIRPRLFERRYSPRVTRFSKAAIDAALENPEYIERPPGEVEIEKLRGFARPFTFWTGIYFLFLDDELVYVGQALHIPSRLCDHVPGVNRDREQVWNRYATFECRREDLDAMESHFIREFRPRYNKR